MTEEHFDLFQSEMAVTALRKDAALLPRIGDFEKQQNIKRSFANEEKRLIRTYERDFDKRMDMAARHLARKHSLDLKKVKKQRTPRDRGMFRKLMRYARREVDGDHRRRMTRHYSNEAKELRALLEAARDRENGPQPSEPPKRITDQRDDLHRVGPTRDR